MITLEELTVRLEELGGQFVGGSITEVLLSKPASDLLAAIKNRVKNRGEGSNGNSLSAYSTKPIYASQEQFVRGGFVPQGKNNFKGNTIGDRLIPTVRLKTNGIKSNLLAYSKYSLVKPNLKERKTMYLKDGYKELRDVQGLPTDITNMSYSGQMMADYQQSNEGNKILLGITTERSAKIYDGQTNGNSRTKGKGQFFQASTGEMANFKEAVDFQTARITRGILQYGETIYANITQ